MTPSLMKRFWSFLKPILIETTSSSHNELLQVWLANGQWQLMTQGAIYSYGLRYDNFRRVFDRFTFSHLPGQEVLLLGLGLGSIPYMLEKHYKQPLAYTAVEIDPVVVQLAYRYVLDEIKSPVDVIVGDAEVFLACTDYRFDLICLDIFKDAHIPPFFTSEACFKRLSEMLTPGGILLFNHLGERHADRLEAQRIAQSAKCFFPQGHLIFTGTNYIFASDSGYLRVAHRQKQ